MSPYTCNPCLRSVHLGGILALAVGGYAGLSLLLADRFTRLRRERKDRVIAASPADEGLPFQDVTFPADVDGLTISGWLIPRPDSATAVIMIPSGGAHRLNPPIDQLGLEGGQLKLARALWERGCTVLLYDPRGTGRSEGDRLSYGSLEARDLIGALRFLEGRGYPAQRVGILAWSMGAATALFALPKVRYGGLVVDSGLGSFSHEDIARYAARAMGLPLPVLRVATRVLTFGAFAAARLLWGMDLGAKAADELGRHPVPTLVIHGTADSQVPVSSGEEIARAAGDALIAAYLLEGVEHVGAYASDPAWYVRTVCGTFDEVLR